MTSKYHNRKTTVDSITFDSIAEARRYQDLKIMERAGLIARLTCQPKFLLAEAFTYNGKKERAIYYIADFQYLKPDTDEWVIEDTKGKRTEVYKLKRKLFLAKFGHLYDFQEVAA